MPRPMPSLAQTFAESSAAAVAFADGVEAARDRLSALEARQHLPPARLEMAYELAYLRVFVAWEDFLEESMLRYLCGYRALHGQETLVAGNYSPHLTSARARLYGTRDFLLWHNPRKVIDRAKGYFSGSRHETVLASCEVRVGHFAAIRHRVAHAHGGTEFDQATMALAGRRYPGARPGRFLRELAPQLNPPGRRLEAIVAELRGLAFQIVPP